MVQINPRQIIGKWREGYALDLHTLSSVPIGHNEFGHMQFDTKRSDIGELLYRLKYSSDTTVVDEIAEAADQFIRSRKMQPEVVVPVPPSTVRRQQPVIILATAISSRLGIPVVDCVQRTRDVPQLKNVYDLDERLKLLDSLHAVDPAQVSGKRILLFDDLYRSGATMNAVTVALYELGKAADVCALTITRTRSYR